MKDVPDSASDSDANDTFKGLSNTAIYIGEGALLYLQIIKSLTILFLILSIINIPIYAALSNYTYMNDYNSLNEFPKYFTVGNIGVDQTHCNHDQLNYE